MRAGLRHSEQSSLSASPSFSPITDQMPRGVRFTELTTTPLGCIEPSLRASRHCTRARRCLRARRSPCCQPPPLLLAPPAPPGESTCVEVYVYAYTHLSIRMRTQSGVHCLKRPMIQQLLSPFDKGFEHSSSSLTIPEPLSWLLAMGLTVQATTISRGAPDGQEHQ